MNLAVIGSGFVGLTTGACLAELGHHVVCMDTDARKVVALQSGTVPFYEPGLPELVRRNRDAGRLRFTTDADIAIQHVEIAFLCVGTPANPDGSADLSMLMAAAEAVGRYMEQSLVVVQKSTAPVGTLSRLDATIGAQLQLRGKEFRYSVVSNPEFLREGSAVQDFLHPDRVVVGGHDADAVARVASLYQPLLSPERIFRMDAPSAEMSKYAANAFLAARISLINEIANLCEVSGADVEHVRRVVGADPRIGPLFLSPGVGYGGSCFPKDVQALIRWGRDMGYKPEILVAVDRVNQLQRRRLVQRIAAALAGTSNAMLTGKRIAIWGLAFKPGTNDMREAPAATVISELLQRGAIVSAYDPVAMEGARLMFNGTVRYVDEPFTCVDGADALVVITEWPEFGRIDLKALRRRMAGGLLFDGRNALNREAAVAAGFVYHGVGQAMERLTPMATQGMSC